MKLKVKKTDLRKPALSKKIRKGDRVIAISGNSKGQAGIVLSRQGEKVIVQGLNVRKKTVKGTKDSKGGIIELERPIHQSNLKVCTEDNQPIKLKVRTGSNNERELYYKVDGDQEVLYRSIKRSKN